jgi:hypothetical protein
MLARITGHPRPERRACHPPRTLRPSHTSEKSPHSHRAKIDPLNNVVNETFYTISCAFWLDSRYFDLLTFVRAKRTNSTESASTNERSTRMTIRRQIELEIDLKIRFKGDQETGQQLHSGMQSALGGLAASQARVLGIPEVKRVIDVPSEPSNRRRRRRSRGNDSAATPTLAQRAAEFAEGDGDVATGRTHRSKGVGPVSLTRSLADAGFFGEERSVASVVTELSNKGHIFESRNVSSACKKLTEEEVLTRRNTEQGFLYRSAAQ